MGMEVAMVVRSTSTALHPYPFSSKKSLSSPRARKTFNLYTNSAVCRIPVIKSIQSPQAEAQGSTFSPRQRRHQNVDGEFFVDHTCIDCDTCRWMAPNPRQRTPVILVISEELARRLAGCAGRMPPMPKLDN